MSHGLYALNETGYALMDNNTQSYVYAGQMTVVANTVVCHVDSSFSTTHEPCNWGASVPWTWGTKHAIAMFELPTYPNVCGILNSSKESLSGSPVYRVYLFSTVTPVVHLFIEAASTPSADSYGLRLYDASGGVVFDSGRPKILSLVAQPFTVSGVFRYATFSGSTLVSHNDSWYSPGFTLPTNALIGGGSHFAYLQSYLRTGGKKDLYTDRVKHSYGFSRNSSGQIGLVSSTQTCSSGEINILDRSGCNVKADGSYLSLPIIVADRSQYV